MIETIQLLATNKMNFAANTRKLAFDLGAYDGKDTLNLIAAGYNVVAVEANPYRFKTKLKPLAYVYDNICCENVCISDKSYGFTDFYLS